METQKGEIILYQREDGSVQIDVRMEDETVWLTQEQMAALFGKGRSTITEHISHILEEGELDENVVCRNFRQTTQHGAIEGKTQEREVKHYNLDLYATASDYNPNSPETIEFFKIVQNKLHYAAYGHTANETIYFRVDSNKPFAGLTNFKGDEPTQAEAMIAKNYLEEKQWIKPSPLRK